MQKKQSFTGRQRRLTNRWSVRFADTMARAVITIGGVSTIAAVLLVFFLLVYVSLPLFNAASLHGIRSLEATENRHVVLQGLHSSGVIAWHLADDGQFEQTIPGTTEVLASSQLLEQKGEIRSASFILEPEEVDRNLIQDFCLGLADGNVVLGKLAAKVSFRDATDLPEEQRQLPMGSHLLVDRGILEHTPQGMYRFQSLAMEAAATSRISDRAIIDIDYLREGSRSEIVALDESGRLFHITIVVKESILSDAETTLESREIRLPKDLPDQPWHVRFIGRGTELALLWKNGQLARLGKLESSPVEVIETVFTCETGCELTAVLMQQGRYTMVVGDNHGQISTWHTGRDENEPDAPSRLVRGHVLPPLSAAVTALGRSMQTRMIVAGSAAGEVATYHVTTERQLTYARVADKEEVQLVSISPSDNYLLAQTRQHVWSAGFTPEYPEVSWRNLFTPVVYEGYIRPQHKWQSTAGTSETEPKFGMLPLIFGTLKATFYSMLIGAPLAVLAAVYTSEFIHPRYKAPIKSSVEMMSMIPSVVLGYLAGMVFAPFVESVLPAVISSFFVIPFCFLVGAQAWQLLPQKLALRLTELRFLFLGITLVAGMVLSFLAGPYLEQLLFAGDLARWLGGDTGTGVGGWFILLLPLSVLGIATLINNHFNPWWRMYCGQMSRAQFVPLNLAKFVVATIITCLVTWLAALLLTWLGIDSRGGVLDSYVQKNSLVVGFVMGFAIVPIIYTISEDALSTVPQHLRSASLGCGATPWQTTWRVVIPTAASGLFSAIMIGFGRAIGETMIMLMATGNVPIMSTNVFNGFRSLSANIAEELPEAAQWGTHFRILFLSGVILMVLTFTVNTAAEMVRISFRRKAKQL